MLDKAKAIEPEIIRLRRDIHQHPELAFQEFRTAQLVAETLGEIGYGEVKTEVGRTGVMAQIGTGEGPTIGIRADMDALPMPEATDVPFKSVNDGVMHACGHDAHTAVLLGVAHLLRQSFAEEGEKWQGNVRLLFQPSEESWDKDGISGATAMAQDEALEDLEAVIALHVGSRRPSGVVHFSDGYALAAADMFYAYIRGDGGHGAYPHEGSDPLFMLSAILPQIYGIPSRRVGPLESAVISLGSIQAGKAPNVIPGEVYLNGTIRTFKPEVRQQVFEELEKVLKTAELMGGSYELHIDEGYPSLYNDRRVNDWMRQVTADLGIETYDYPGPMGMAGEDFAYMTQKAPGAMFSLGASNGGGAHHQVNFDLDEEALHKGAAVLAETARRFVLGELGLE